MNCGSVLVYYNDNYGFIFASETTIKGSIIHVTMDPVIIGNWDLSHEEIGTFFFEALDKSRVALPVERSEIQNYKFWQCAKIKSFTAFSRDFKCLYIVEKEDIIQMKLLAREKNGSYGYPINNQKKAQLSNTSSKEEAGFRISQLLLDEKSPKDDNQISFSTINNNMVKYIRPDDEFNDIGDGHTDAYQIYTYDEEQQTYIALLIDNNYTIMSEEGIYARWTQIYGNLIQYEYKQKDEIVKITAMCKTENYEIYANFFQDTNDLMEVMVQIDTKTISKENQEKILNEYTRLVNSIVI